MVQRFCVGILLAGSVSACDESLPPYETPTGFLHAILRYAGTDTVRYIQSDNNNPDRSPARFEQLTAFDLFVVNTYEETLQEEAEITGSIIIQTPESPLYSQVVQITGTAIQSSHIGTDGTITLDPGDTAAFRLYWNHRMNDTTWAFTKAKIESNSPAYGDEAPAIYYFSFHENLRLSASGSVKLFRSFSPVPVPGHEFFIRYIGKIYCCF